MSRSASTENIWDTGHSIQIWDCPEKFRMVGNPSSSPDFTYSNYVWQSCFHCGINYPPRFLLQTVCVFFTGDSKHICRALKLAITRMREIPLSFLFPHFPSFLHSPFSSTPPFSSHLPFPSPPLPFLLYLPSLSPSLPHSLPSPPRFLPSHPISSPLFPFPPRSDPPQIQRGGLGTAVSSPSGVRDGALAANAFLWH